MHTCRARAHDIVIGAQLDNGDVDPRQRQLTAQHEACRAASGDHHRVLGHCHAL
jgi:hypothetical protein